MMAHARFRFGAIADGNGLVWAFGGHRLCTTGWNDDWGSPDCANVSAPARTRARTFCAPIETESLPADKVAGCDTC